LTADFCAQNLSGKPGALEVSQLLVQKGENPLLGFKACATAALVEMVAYNIWQKLDHSRSVGIAAPIPFVFPV
jgi:hypothetical protein